MGTRGRVGLVAALLALASTGRLWAEDWTRPPVLSHPFAAASRQPHARAPVTGLRVGAARIRFEKTRWSDIRRRLGRLRLRLTGDAREGLTWTCFTVGAAGAPVQIWLEGSALTGGETIDGVTAAAGTPWPLAECPPVDPGPGPVMFNQGLGIGATRSELLQRLGPPSAEHGNDLSYDFSVTVHDPRLGRGTTDGRISFALRAGRVVRLSASQDTAF